MLALSSGADISLTLHLPVASAQGPITSTFLSNTQTTSYSLYTPPSSPALKPAGTILALHGAGLDPAKSPEWTSSIPQRPSEWIVWPIGLTPWVRSRCFVFRVGSDLDLRATTGTAAVCTTSRPRWHTWRTSRSAGLEPCRWITVSSKGPLIRGSLFSATATADRVRRPCRDRERIADFREGAWFFLARFPDEVLGGVPASG